MLLYDVEPCVVEELSWVFGGLEEGSGKADEKKKKKEEEDGEQEIEGPFGREV